MRGETLRDLQRKIIVLAVSIVLATGAAVAISVLLPMQSQMRDEANSHIRHSLELKHLAVDQYLTRLTDIGRQIVSRTQIRKRLISYNQGQVTLEDVRAFSDPRLAEALNEAGDAIGMVRLDKVNQAVSTVGIVPPENIWQQASTVGDPTVLIGPLVHDGRLVVCAVTAIFDEKGEHHGTDIVMFQLDGLASILTNKTADDGAVRLSFVVQYSADAARTFGTLPGASQIANLGEVFPWASLEEMRSSTRGVVVARGQDGLERAIASTSLNVAEWVLVEMEGTDTLYADARQTLQKVVVVIVVMIALGSLLVMRLLHGLTGQVLVTTEELQRQIAERTRAQKLIFQAKEEAEQANQAKSDFLSSMSHELRTPLNAVLGFGQLLQMDPKATLTPTQHEHLQCILDGGAHLLDLVNQILDLARIEANQAFLNLENVDAIEIVTDCLGFSMPLAESHHITITNEIAQGAEVILRTDPLRFKQLLLNILSNAIKYNKDGGEVRVGGWEVKNGYYHLYVTDTGIGIAEKDRPYVFNMFHRLGDNPSIAREGTGIGLAVTKLLVEQMAGHVGFESKVGVGTTFWVELPLSSNTNAVIWEDTLQVGVTHLDVDHQKIVALMNKINHQSISTNELAMILEELSHDTRDHFKREEVVMEACDYPDIKAHKVLHQDLLAQIDAVVKEWDETRDVAVLAKLQKVLKDLWLVHISQEDIKIAQYTTGKNAKVREALGALSLREYEDVLGG